MESFALDNESNVPPYEQLRLQILGRVESGDLVVGTKLPTVRGLANSLGVAVNTVAKTYRELEKSGTIETRGRRGTFIASSGGTDVKAQRAADRFAAVMHDLGVDEQTAMKFAKAALRARCVGH